MVVEYLSNHLILGHPGIRFASAVAVFFLVWAVLYLLKEVGLSRIKKLAEQTTTDADDKLIEAVAGLPSFVYIIIGLWAASSQLVLSAGWERTLNVAVLIVLGYLVIKIISIAIDVFAAISSAKKNQQQQSMVRLMAKLGKLVVWIIAILLLLDNFGVEITPLLAGLGIGGVAIAFAFQSVIEDLFAAFTIYFDKPFEVGDFIILTGGDTGTVKHVGLRTTRIATLQGQELIVSNRELTSTRVQNFKKMKKRRVVFSLGLEYGTSVTKLKKANTIIEQIFSDIENADLDRVHFKEFADWSLNFEIVYFMNNGDYAEYMDTQQAINFEIAQRFAKAKLEMAFPTQTLHVKK